MKIGFCALSWMEPTDPPDTAWFAELKSIGYDGIEVPVVHGERDDFLRLRDALDEAGLRRTALTVMPPGTNPVSESESERAAGARHIAWAIETAHAIGAELLVGPIHQTLGVFTGKPPSGAEFARMAAFHRRAGELAAPLGLKIAVEPMNRFECHMLNRMAQLVPHLESVGHPAVTGLYDTFHANVEEADPVGALARNLRHVGHFHVSENDRGIPGSGHIPWHEFFRTLKAGGYDQWITVEAFGLNVPTFAAVASVWRDIPEGRSELCRRSFRLIREGWDAA